MHACCFTIHIVHLLFISKWSQPFNINKSPQTTRLWYTSSYAGICQYINYADIHTLLNALHTAIHFTSFGSHDRHDHQTASCMITKYKNLHLPSSLAKAHWIHNNLWWLQLHIGEYIATYNIVLCDKVPLCTNYLSD